MSVSVLNIYSIFDWYTDVTQNLTPETLDISYALVLNVTAI
jgi:hypothetical protein